MVIQMTTRKKTGTKVTRGDVKVANDIVEKIAAIAAGEIEGVADFAPKSGLQQLFGLLGPDRGVRVEVGSKEVAVDLDIAVEYGSRIPDVVRNIRRNITQRINEMTGLEVVELNIRVNDLHFPDEGIPLTQKGEIPEARVK